MVGACVFPQRFEMRGSIQLEEAALKGGATECIRKAGKRKKI